MAISDIRTAEDTEAVLKKLDDKIEAIARQTSGAGGLVAAGRPAVDVAVPATAEKVTVAVLANLTAGRRYKASWLGDLAAGDSPGFPGYAVKYSLRYIAGNQPTSVAGTVFMVRDMRGIYSHATPLEAFGDFVAPSSGEFTVSATMSVYDASKTVYVLGFDQSTHRPLLLLEDIGV